MKVVTTPFNIDKHLTLVDGDMSITTSGTRIDVGACAVTIDGNLYNISAGNVLITSALVIPAGSMASITVGVNSAGTFSLHYSKVEVGTVYNMNNVAGVSYNEALVGYIVLVNNTGSTFTGGTTDATSLVETVIVA